MNGAVMSQAAASLRKWLARTICEIGRFQLVQFHLGANLKSVLQDSGPRITIAVVLRLIHSIIASFAANVWLSRRDSACYLVRAYQCPQAQPSARDSTRHPRQRWPFRSRRA